MGSGLAVHIPWTSALGTNVVTGFGLGEMRTLSHLTAFPSLPLPKPKSRSTTATMNLILQRKCPQSQDDL